MKIMFLAFQSSPKECADNVWVAPESEKSFRNEPGGLQREPLFCCPLIGRITAFPIFIEDNIGNIEINKQIG